jgi:hypothetical protein
VFTTANKKAPIEEQPALKIKSPLLRAFYYFFLAAFFLAAFFGAAFFGAAFFFAAFLGAAFFAAFLAMVFVF